MICSHWPNRRASIYVQLFSDSLSQVLHVNVGDELLSAGVVTGLLRTECTGLIAPVTRAGTLVVDGVVTSDCEQPMRVDAKLMRRWCFVLQTGQFHRCWATKPLTLWFCRCEQLNGHSPSGNFGNRLQKMAGTRLWPSDNTWFTWLMDEDLKQGNWFLNMKYCKEYYYTPDSKHNASSGP